jgi:hypothetical protein
MSEIIGKQLEVGFGAETTRGVTSSSPVWAKNISANVLEKAEYANDESVRGVFEDMDGRRVVRKHIEGDVEMPLYVDMFGYLAWNLYGSVSTAVVAGSVKDHTFSLLQETIAPSLTIFAKDGDTQQLVFKNSHINTLSLSAVTDDYIKITTGFLGKESADDTSSPSYSADTDFIGRDITIKVADTLVGLATAEEVCVSSVDLNWDKGLIIDHCLGAYVPNDFYISKMSIEGSLTKKFVDETFKDLYLGNDAKYMEIVIEGETALTGEYKPTITLTLNKVQITDWSRGGGRDELVNEEVSFKAFYNSTDSKQSELKLRNTVAEYEVSISE